MNKNKKTEMQNTILTVTDYDKIDGRCAFDSQNKMLSLGFNESEIIEKIWKLEDGKEEMTAIEFPLHQVIDLAIFACKGLVYFEEAYRYPKLYDPNNPVIGRIELQGSVMNVEVCMKNSNIDKEILLFSNKINAYGEMIGERIRVLSSLLEEMGY